LEAAIDGEVFYVLFGFVGNESDSKFVYDKDMVLRSNTGTACFAEEVMHLT